jgi:hypothetical protein
VPAAAGAAGGSNACNAAGEVTGPTGWLGTYNISWVGLRVAVAWGSVGPAASIALQAFDLKGRTMYN